MTRPAMRMCARCHCTTSHPVLVHEVHAATGPGFNVYACPECADHYPAMTDPLELPETPRRRSRLTLRVYKVNAQGTVTEDRGKVEVLTAARTANVGIPTMRMPPLPDTRTHPRRGPHHLNGRFRHRSALRRAATRIAANTLNHRPERSLSVRGRTAPRHDQATRANQLPRFIPIYPAMQGSSLWRNRPTREYRRCS
jgi:hypothetical protein